jgi:hypothetical protein
MSTIQNKSAIFIQIYEDQVVNCVDLVWIAQIPNILNDRPEQHKNCPEGKECPYHNNYFFHVGITANINNGNEFLH